MVEIQSWFNYDVVVQILDGVWSFFTEKWLILWVRPVLLRFVAALCYSS